MNTVGYSGDHWIPNLNFNILIQGNVFYVKGSVINAEDPTKKIWLLQDDPKEIEEFVYLYLEFNEGLQIERLVLLGESEVDNFRRENRRDNDLKVFLPFASFEKNEDFWRVKKKYLNSQVINNQSPVTNGFYIDGVIKNINVIESSGKSKDGRVFVETFSFIKDSDKTILRFSNEDPNYTVDLVDDGDEKIKYIIDTESKRVDIPLGYIRGYDYIEANRALTYYVAAVSYSYPTASYGELYADIFELAGDDLEEETILLLRDSLKTYYQESIASKFSYWGDLNNII